MHMKYVVISSTKSYVATWFGTREAAIEFFENTPHQKAVLNDKGVLLRGEWRKKKTFAEALEDAATN